MGCGAGKEASDDDFLSPETGRLEAELRSEEVKFNKVFLVVDRPFNLPVGERGPYFKARRCDGQAERQGASRRMVSPQIVWLPSRVQVAPALPC